MGKLSRITLDPEGSRPSWDSWRPAGRRMRSWPRILTLSLKTSTNPWRTRRGDWSEPVPNPPRTHAGGAPGPPAQAIGPVSPPSDGTEVGSERRLPRPTTGGNR